MATVDRNMSELYD